MNKKRVLSGIRATGRLHLGNYLGAVMGMLELQDDPQKNKEYERFFMIADVHTITTPYKVEELKANRLEEVLDYLACGLDPQQSTIFLQSDVPEHLELAFYFSSVATIARMQHLPTYKEKVKQYPHDNTLALLNYPILMAADILVYKADSVPVGIDQEPHLEVAREIARKMKEQYGVDFPEPKRFETSGQYIPSLKGEGKMSKSVEGSYIKLSDSVDEVRKKIRSIPTATVAGGDMTGGIKTLFTLAEIYLSKEEYSFFKSNFDNGNLPFVQIKDAVAKAISAELEPIQKKREYYANNPDEVKKILKEGAEKARLVARATVDEVKTKMGLGKLSE